MLHFFFFLSITSQLCRYYNTIKFKYNKIPNFIREIMMNFKKGAVGTTGWIIIVIVIILLIWWFYFR